jgi:hypothetical protein
MTTTTTMTTAQITNGLNGADVIAHDAESGATYIRLPVQLQRPIDGGCHCPSCKANPTRTPTWDTLAIPPKGTAWTVHMPDAQMFRDYLASR